VPLGTVLRFLASAYFHALHSEHFSFPWGPTGSTPRKDHNCHSTADRGNPDSISSWDSAG
jgi:hypothetical protein